MLACIDVDYRDNDTRASVACLLFDSWSASEPTDVVQTIVTDVAPYVPGQFYRRELPCLLAVLAQAPALPKLIIVDGYVWLGVPQKMGLGAYLHEALEQKTTIVGVAKNPFVDSGAVPVLRGDSSKPLYVTAEGMSAQQAATHVQQMHGDFRFPTLLKLVDQLARTYVVGDDPLSAT